MGPNEVNGIVVSDQSAPFQPPEPKTTPMDHGVIQTDDFQASGNLKMLYQHLREMYNPPIESKSGPIKAMTPAEIEHEKNKPIENAINEIPPTVSR